MLAPHCYLVVAMAKNRAIGIKNELPWKLRKDLQHFKRLTEGNRIVMGRKTFESIGNKPLPNRKNVVLTRNSDAQARTTPLNNSVVFASSFLEAVSQKECNEKIFVIGGEEIYRLALSAHCVKGIFLTRVELEPEGDAFFPEFEKDFSLRTSDFCCENGIGFHFEYWELTDEPGSQNCDYEALIDKRQEGLIR
jgi:dihydrofolate reductase